MAGTESLNLRVSPELKRRVKEYRDTLGVPINSAAIMLLDRALKEVEIERVAQAAARSEAQQRAGQADAASETAGSAA